MHTRVERQDLVKAGVRLSEVAIRYTRVLLPLGRGVARALQTLGSPPVLSTGWGSCCSCGSLDLFLTFSVFLS